MSLFQLVYVSTIDVPAEQQDDVLKDIIGTARKNNKANNLTGMLFFTGQYFIQYLEGDRSKVSACFETIMLDDRHTNIQVVYADHCDERQFEKWSMSLINIRPSGREQLAPYLPKGHFNPYELDGLTVRRMTLKAFEKLAVQPPDSHFLD